MNFLVLNRRSIKQFFLFVTAFFALLQNNAWAQTSAPALPSFAANAYVLKDVSSQMILAEKNSDKQIEPASLTKLMTAYLVFQALHDKTLTLEETLKISEYAHQAEGSRMFIELNTPVSIDELLFGMIVQSGNDASIALAERVSGTEAQFAKKMNAQAKRLGMTNTNFMNATGLPDPKHYTTANDLLMLAEAIILDFPTEYARYYSTKDYTYNNIKQNNRNRLLWLDPNVDGMKTGHTQSAGYCLIATAKRDGVRRISVLLGAPSDAARATESQKLLNYGFMHYETVLLYKKGQTIKTFKVWKGVTDTVDAVAKDDVYVTVLKGQANNLKGIVASIQPLLAPIKAQQDIGNIKLTLDGEVVLQLPLVAKSSVSSAGMFGQMWDSIKLLVE